MSNRVSQTILLGEDELHERLVKAYMKECGLETHAPCVYPVIARQMQQGGNVDWVLRGFPIQVQACRGRLKRAKTRLLVMIGAETLTVEERRRQLTERLEQAGHDKLTTSDPVVLLIPRWHAEPWGRCLLGETGH